MRKKIDLQFRAVVQAEATSVRVQHILYIA